MARVTVEDCAEVVPSRFELVALAAQRARTISAGGEITVSRDNDKNAVIALREIADQTVDADFLREQVIQARQTQVNVDQYGVEEADEDSENASYSSGEAAADMAEMQGQIDEDVDSDMVYGEDDVEVDD